MSHVPGKLGAEYYRGFLNRQGRDCYDHILEQLNKKDYSGVSSSVAIRDISSAASDCFAAYKAVRDDHPEFFFLGFQSEFTRIGHKGILRYPILYSEDIIERVQYQVRKSVCQLVRGTAGLPVIEREILVYERIAKKLSYNNHGDVRDHNILIDEVHALLDHGEGATQEEKALNNTMSQLLINIITELRAYGVGVVFSDQSPSRIGGCMLDNVDNLISFRLSGEEADLLRAHMGAIENLTACLPLARTGEFFLKNQYIREPLGIRMSKAKVRISPHNYSDRQIASMQKEYLQSRAAIYCPYKFCKAAGCNFCSIAIREEAHKYATQIYNERQDKLGTVEAIASHILKIPTVVGTKSRNLPDSGTPKLFHCIAIHLLRVCALEKGISISNEAVIKLLMDMDRTAKEGIKNE